MTRSFTIDSVLKAGKRIRFKGGRYESKTPAAAVKKAFSQVVRHYGKKAANMYTINLKETTQNSKHKVYSYKVKRVKNPVEIERDGKMITFTYKTIVKSI